jgi:D-glycero-alpha-D-manno-heptose-7-phosphate kinase
MIVTRAPLRISLFGGGSDMPEFFCEQEYGAVLSFAINRYVYITLHPIYKRNGYLLKYSRTENCFNVDEIEHSIIKAVFKRYQIDGVELSVSADVPAGTGMGSSSAFTISLLLAVKTYLNLPFNALSVAQEACDIEINVLKAPIGYQDQFASALGGINHLKFAPGGVEILKSWNEDSVADEFNQRFVLVETGFSRSANLILEEQRKNISSNKDNSNGILLKMRDMSFTASKMIDASMFEFGEMLTDSWEMKKSLANSISNSQVEATIQKGMARGATGAKLGGAGAGGFVIFSVIPGEKNSFIKSMIEAGFYVDSPRVSSKGCEVILND